MANSKLAKGIYKTLCGVLKDNDFVLEKVSKNLMVHSATMSDCGRIHLSMQVDDTLEIVRFLSPIFIDIKDEFRSELAVAVTTINNDLIAGCFDFDYDEKTLFFCLSSTFTESVIGKGMLEYMLRTVISMVVKYHDKLERVASGEMNDFSEIVEYIRRSEDD